MGFMWIVSVLPIGKVAAHRELSYFSSAELAEGSIAAIPLRGQAAYGLVMKCAPLADMRQHVKSAGFSLQKISGGGRRLVTREFLRAIFEIADQHACSAGAVLDDLVPQAVLEAGAKMPEAEFTPAPLSATSGTPVGLRKSRGGTSFLIAPRGGRITEYIRFAKKTLASGRSFLLIAPTIVEAERIAQSLTAASARAVVLLHGSLSKKKMRDAWRSIAEQPQPLIIVGTAAALSAPRRDFGMIIVERAGARGYERDERPFLDIEACARVLAETLPAQFIAAAAAPTTLSAFLSSPIVPTAAFASAGPRIEIADMRPPQEDKEKTGRPDFRIIAAAKKHFELFSPQARQIITRALAAHERVLLLCARRGLATHTVCDDCGSVFSCSACGTAMSLYDEMSGGRTVRIFKCPYCGLRESARATCCACGGWRLSALGIGLERVAAEAQKLFPDQELFIADEKTLAQPKRAAALIAEFETTPAGILIATEGALPYLSSSVACSIAVSVDSLLSLPEYSASERAFQILSELRGMTAHDLLIQTRMPDQAALRALAAGTPKDFLREELELRERFLYPPYATFVRITLSGSKAHVETEHTGLIPALATYKPQIFAGKMPRRALKSGRRSTARALVREHILIRIPHEKWPDKRVLHLLRQLPPSIEIRVDPKTIFLD